MVELAALNPTAAGGGTREDEMAQRSKFCEANSKQRILGTARVTRNSLTERELTEYMRIWWNWQTRKI